MEEQMPSSDSENLDIETIRSRIGDLSEIIRSSKDTSEESSSPELKILLEIFSSKIKQVGFRNFDSLTPEELDAYLKEAQKQLNVVEVENTTIYNEIEVLRRTYIQDSIQLEKDFDELNFSLKHLDAQDLNKSELGPNVDISIFSSGNLVHQQEDYNFELLKLDHQIEAKKSTLSSLEDLDDFLKRVEAVCQIEDKFTGLKAVEFNGNGIRLSLETFIPKVDDLLSQQKMKFTPNPSTVYHELFIEVYDGTLELKSVEIFPNDVCIDEIFEDAKSSWKLFPILSFQSVTASLQSLVQRMQDRIVLCTLRRVLVKDANTSRHSLEYSDRDDTVIAHMASGIDALIKLPYSWPLLQSALKCISLKCPNNPVKELSLSSCKVEELGNSLDAPTQQNLSSFVDAIEKMLKEYDHNPLHQ
ncbi:RNA-directed DNA polymerase (reverse transcriptase)-related family protein [Thalictrum thalictroides]|uniref:RNA-directed DNA polymerase (Reverse transcriptase)-related family protein n=1 Tax=Thalictrum thalictroides TaxID=46969 RepID=A0A7J6WPW9_THATH|nr:RNA-directed DNA polymerase (reverse transcriptase)-related family protein [Thalictrum thalictroides]